MTKRDFVALLDPDTISVDLLVFALEEVGVLTEKAVNWEHFLDLAAESEARVLVFHCDDPIPLALNRLHELFRRVSWPIPVVVTTRLSDEVRRQELVEKAGVQVVLKPYDIREFTALLQEKHRSACEERFLMKELIDKEELSIRATVLQRHLEAARAYAAAIYRAAREEPSTTGEVFVAVLDSNQQYLMFTPDYERLVARLTGMAPVVGQKLANGPWPENLHAYVEAVEEMFRANTSAEVVLTVSGEEGTFRIHVRGQPLFDNFQRPWATLVHLRVLDPLPGVPSENLPPSLPDTLRSLILNLGGAHLLVDARGRILELSPHSSAILGEEASRGSLLDAWVELAQPLGELEESCRRAGPILLRRRAPNTGVFLAWVRRAGSGAEAPFTVSLYPLGGALEQLLVSSLEYVRLCMAVFDSQNKILATTPSWRKKLGREPLNLSPQRVVQTVRLRSRPWKVFSFFHQPLGLRVVMAVPWKRGWHVGRELSLIGLIAHQWRQPLAELSTLIGLIQLQTVMGRAPATAVESSVQRAQSLIQHLSRTIDDFRLLTGGKPSWEVIDLSSVSSLAIHLFQEWIIRNAIHVDFKPAPAPAALHRGLATQAVVEAVFNALKALLARERGRVLRLEVLAADSQVTLRIAHNGSAFPPAILAAMKSGKSPPTSGIGLRFVRRVLRLHGGEFQAYHNGEWVYQELAFPTRRPG